MNTWWQRKYSAFWSRFPEVWG